MGGAVVEHLGNTKTRQNITTALNYHSVMRECDSVYMRPCKATKNDGGWELESTGCNARWTKAKAQLRSTDHRLNPKSQALCCVSTTTTITLERYVKELWANYHRNLSTNYQLNRLYQTQR